MAAPVLELHGHRQVVRRDPGADRRRPDARARRGARADGRQRRRQVDAGRRSSPAASRPPPARCCSMGAPVRFARPVEARRAGIEIVHQDLALCDNLTAALNVFLGRELTRRVGPFRFLDHAAMNARAGKLFAELKSETRPRDLVKSMSGGQRQAVAIARTRLSRPEDRADGRADGGDQRAPGRRGARPDPPPEGDRARGDPDLAPDARRLLGRRPDRGAATRPQGRRQADRGELSPRR